MVVDQPHVLREYALLADGVRGGLVGPRGDCAWLSAPGFDGLAVFGSLLGAGGCYEVTPSGRFVWGGYYEPGTLIWRNRWVTGDSIVECREALAMPPDAHRLALLRRIVAGRGPPRGPIRLAPRAEFGEHGLTDLARSDEGSWTGRSGPFTFRWTGPPDVSVDDGPGENPATLLAERSP